MPPETKQRSLACAAAEDHVGLHVHAVTRNQVEVQPPGSWLLLTEKGKVAAFAVVWMTSDAQLREKNTEGFHDNPYPTQNNSLKRKPPKNTLNYCDKDDECSV